MRHTADPLGIALRSLREQAGLQQGELGLKAAVTQSNVSAYELGKRAPQWPTLLRLLDAMGADLLDLSVRMGEPGRLESTHEALRRLLGNGVFEQPAEGEPAATTEHPLDFLVDAVIDRLTERTALRRLVKAEAVKSPVVEREER
ncbi:MAG: helix-turn-helix transcriptional regulator [Acidobacteriota bacterium]